MPGFLTTGVYKDKRKENREDLTGYEVFSGEISFSVQ